MYKKHVCWPVLETCSPSRWGVWWKKKKVKQFRLPPLELPRHHGLLSIIISLDDLVVLPPQAVYLTEDWELPFEELALYFKCIVITCSSKWQNRSKPSGVNISTLFFCAFPRFLFFPPPFLPPAFLSPSLVVSQPSVIHSQSLLHQRLRFQNGAFLFSFLETQLCCLSLYRGGKKQLTSSHQEKRDSRMKGDARTHLCTEMWKFNLLSSSLCALFRALSVVL